jgi:hypothetical protein
MPVFFATRTNKEMFFSMSQTALIPASIRREHRFEVAAFPSECRFGRAWKLIMSPRGLFLS